MKKQISDLFGGLFNINCHSPDTNPIIPIYNSDMILLHEPSVLEDMHQYIKCECPVLLMRRTITSTALEQLRSIPENSTALVVNLNDYMARDTLVNIYQVGIKNIKMSTWAPGNDIFPKTDYIITHRLYDFLPQNDTPKIVIGSRILTVDLIMDILSYFNIDLATIQNIIDNHLIQSPNFFNGVNSMLENNHFLSTQLDLLFNKINKSIAVVDRNNIISYANSLFGEYLGIELHDIINTSITQLIERVNSLELIGTSQEISNEIIDIDNKKIILNTNNLYNKTSYMGKVITLVLYNQIEYVQQTVHKKLFPTTGVGKYSFNSLLGKDPIFNKAIELGKKVAISNLPVLVYGESGTGKELMASAVHNYSSRSDKPYIAVNCGSIPNDLLESEFFGYEEGAFTGSKKGGSIGFFEKANGGTLFLDEISEIPYNLQSRLLRVIQEHEIRKIGSNYNISIDVRIVSASNKDLFELVEAGLFRRDLYYRINVLQITIPPLRKRKMDIELLLKHFLANTKKEIAPEFLIFFNDYTWPGNVRELKNIINYAHVISDSKIDLSMLPEYLKRANNFENIQINTDLSLVELLILKLIDTSINNEVSTSRASLAISFSVSYFDMSEMYTRKILTTLKDKGYVVIPKGRNGCMLSSLGKDIVNKY